jgi:hypothetical protein
VVFSGFYTFLVVLHVGHEDLTMRDVMGLGCKFDNEAPLLSFDNGSTRVNAFFICGFGSVKGVCSEVCSACSGNVPVESTRESVMKSRG